MLTDVPNASQEDLDTMALLPEAYSLGYEMALHVERIRQEANVASQSQQRKGPSRVPGSMVAFARRQHKHKKHRR